LPREDHLRLVFLPREDHLRLVEMGVPVSSR